MSEKISTAGSSLHFSAFRFSTSSLQGLDGSSDTRHTLLRLG